MTVARLVEDDRAVKRNDADKLSKELDQCQDCDISPKGIWLR